MGNFNATGEVDGEPKTCFLGSLVSKESVRECCERINSRQITTATLLWVDPFTEDTVDNLYNYLCNCPDESSSEQTQANGFKAAP